MMKRNLLKTVAAGLCMVMTAFVLAGCGGGDGKSQSQGGAQTAATSASGTAAGQKSDSQAAAEQSGIEGNGEMTQIVMAFPTAGVEPADLGKIEFRVNEISREKIGVEVKFKPVSLFDATSQIPMWIGGGERLDLMFSAYTGMTPLISQNMVEPMEEYLDTCAPTIKAMAEEGYPMFDPNNTEHIYGVAPMGYQIGTDGGYIISVEDLEAAGLSYENNQQITLDDLDFIFEKIKAAKPDVYPCGVLGNVQRANMTFISDPLGASTSSGVIVGLDSTEVVDYYETEEYQNYLKYAREWYKNGYIMQDAATTDYSLNELITNGTVSGYFSSVDETLRLQLENSTGKSYIILKLIDNFTAAVGGNGFYWALPVTASEPEAAVKFLNLLYEDKDVLNTILWGIEGVHWKFIDEQKGTIDFADGLTSTTTPYSYGYGFFGDLRNGYAMGDKEDIEKTLAKEKTALSRKTKGYGFTYDSSAMTNQIITIDAIVKEYVGALETGSADFDTVYPEFIEKLKTNGIDEIIADKQAQFDAWLAQQ